MSVVAFRLAKWQVGALTVLVAATVQAQPSGGRPIGPAGGMPPGASAGRFGLDGDPDPVGAIIERRDALRLTDVQYLALRDLRRWHQRAERQVRDSLDRLGVVAPETRRPGVGSRPDSSGPMSRPEVRALLDSSRAWTRLARDSALRILTEPQRDSLAAVWARFRDSLPSRLRERGRPPGP